MISHEQHFLSFCGLAATFPVGFRLVSPAVRVCFLYGLLLWLKPPLGSRWPTSPTAAPALRLWVLSGFFTRFFPSARLQSLSGIIWKCKLRFFGFVFQLCDVAVDLKMCRVCERRLSFMLSRVCAPWRRRNAAGQDVSAARVIEQCRSVLVR